MTEVGPITSMLLLSYLERYGVQGAPPRIPGVYYCKMHDDSGGYYYAYCERYPNQTLLDLEFKFVFDAKVIEHLSITDFIVQQNLLAGLKEDHDTQVRDMVFAFEQASKIGEQAWQRESARADKAEVEVAKLRKDWDNALHAATSRMQSEVRELREKLAFAEDDLADALARKAKGCTRCGGSGKLRQPRPRNGATWTPGAACPECKGDGAILVGSNDLLHDNPCDPTSGHLLKATPVIKSTKGDISG